MSFPTLQKNLGFVYLMKGITNPNDEDLILKAQTSFETVHKSIPLDTSTLYGLAVTSRYTGLNKQSIAWAEEGLKIVPTDPFLQLALADALEADGQSEEALKFWQESGSTLLLQQRAAGAENQLDWPLAEKWYVLYLRLNPKDANAIVHLSVTFRRENKLSQAEDVLLKYLTGTTGNQTVYHELGLVYLGESKTNEAALAFSKAIQMDPEDYWSTLFLSNIYLSTRELSRANELVIKSIQINPDYPAPYFNAGRIAVINTDWQKAGDAFTRAIDLAISWNLQKKTPAIAPTELAKYYLELAKVEMETGRLTEAQKAVVQAVTLDPDNVQAGELLDQLK